jgi:hypothetical protein
MHKKYAIYLLFVLFNWQCQPATSGLIENECNLAERYIQECYKTDSLTAIGICKKLETKYPTSDYVKTIVYLSYADIYERWGKDQLAESYANKTLALAKTNKLIREEAKAYLQLAKLSDEYETTLKYLESFGSIANINEATNPALYYEYYYLFGYYFYEIKDIIQSKEYFEKAMKTSEQHNMNLEYVNALIGFAMVLDHQKQYATALQKNEVALRICNNCCRAECGDVYYQKAIILTNLKQYRAAETIIIEAKNRYKAHRNPYNKGVIENILGDIYLAQKKYAEATINYKVFLDKAQFCSTKLWAHKNLYLLYEQTNDYKNVLYHKEKFYQLKDSVYSEEKTAELARLKSDFDKKRAFEVSQTERKNDAILFFIMIIVLAITLLISIFYKRNKLLKLKLELLNTEKQKAEIEYKKRELITNTLHLERYADTLSNIRGGILKINSDTNEVQKKQVKDLTKLIDNTLNDNDNWDNYKMHFEAVSPSFFDTLRAISTKLTDLDLKHCVYLKMKLTPKQVATILGISPKSVTLSRVRIKKKIQLPDAESLSEFIQKIQ